MKKLLFITWSISYCYITDTPKVVWIRGDLKNILYSKLKDRYYLSFML